MTWLSYTPASTGCSTTFSMLLGCFMEYVVLHTILISTPCPKVYLRFGEMTFGWVITALHVRRGHLYGAMIGKSFCPLSGPQLRLASRAIWKFISIDTHGLYTPLIWYYSPITTPWKVGAFIFGEIGSIKWHPYFELYHGIPKQITFLEWSPSLHTTVFIVSDIPSGMYGIYIYIFFLTFYMTFSLAETLTFYLAFFLPFYLASILTYSLTWALPDINRKH